MISFRQSDLIDRIKSQSVEVVFDFHYDNTDGRHYLFIFDPTEFVKDTSFATGNMFFVIYQNHPLNLNNLFFNNCSADFSDLIMARTHELIGVFITKVEQNGYNIRVKEDHIYKKPEGSRYLVFFEINK